MIPARGKGVVKTGLSIHCPHGTYARVAPRSGLAVKNFIDTGAGVVDEDYRGEVGVVLFNHSDVDFPGRGDRQPLGSRAGGAGQGGASRCTGGVYPHVHLQPGMLLGPKHGKRTVCRCRGCISLQLSFNSCRQPSRCSASRPPPC